MTNELKTETNCKELKEEIRMLQEELVSRDTQIVCATKCLNEIRKLVSCSPRLTDEQRIGKIDSALNDYASETVRTTPLKNLYRDEYTQTVVQRDKALEIISKIRNLLNK